MIRSSSSKNLAFDSEIDRTFHRRLRERRVNLVNLEVIDGNQKGNKPNQAVDGNGNNHNQVAANENIPIQAARNEAHRSMWEFFMPTVDGVAPSIAWPTI